MTDTGQQVKRCIFPGCGRPAVPAHLLGGPQPSFCELETHNALTAHLKRRELDRYGGVDPSPPDPEE